MGSVLSVFKSEQSVKMVEENTDEEFYDALDYCVTEELQTDAVKNKIKSVFNNDFSTVTVQAIEEIEPKLSFYEKVSLVFLLYKNEDLALQQLLVEFANKENGFTTNIITKWALSKEANNDLIWKKEFVEALALIKNYSLLRQLGFNKDDLVIDYVLNQPYCSVYLNVVLKALYFLCEDLSADETKRFLKHLIDDLPDMSSKFHTFGAKYLEIYLLHCMSLKYITKNDLTNVIKILKKMDLINKAETLEFISNNNSINNQNDLKTQCEQEIKDFTAKCSDYSIIRSNSTIQSNSFTNNVYTIDPKNVGICLIINQKKFYKQKLERVTLEQQLEFLSLSSHDLEERKGTDVDKEKLSSTFTKLGFRIRILENLKHNQIIPSINQTLSLLSQQDSCFVVCILSHGIENEIYGCNSLPVSIADIKDTLHACKTLLGKPKVLIIQSCQGRNIQKVHIMRKEDKNVTDGPAIMGKVNTVNNETGIPQKRDLLVSMSTVSGFASIRNEETGSWFIQELCKSIEEDCENNHFLNILTNVIAKVSNKICFLQNGIAGAMVPEYSSTLSKLLYLPKVH